MNCRSCALASGVRSLSCADPGTASHSPPCKASSARCGFIMRAAPDGDDEKGRRARRRRSSLGPPQEDPRR
eukprot:7106635-Alexandrium_andersonii.AAC.1